MIEKISKILVLVFVFLIGGSSPPAFSQEVTLDGKAKEYAGDQLTFYTYEDWITQTRKDLARCTVDSSGAFQVDFPLGTTTQVFLDIGIYKAYLFVEPGIHYEIVLPDKKEKSKAQRLNPYFRGFPYHIGIKKASDGELNHQIYNYLKKQASLFNKFEGRLNSGQVNKDSICHVLDTLIQSENQFFRKFKKFKLGGVKMTLRAGPDSIKKDLFANEPVYYRNPAYMELFSSMYENYFRELYFKYGYLVNHLVNRKQSYYALDTLMQKNNLLKSNAPLRKLVLIKGLYDAYASREFSKKGVLAILDSVPVYDSIPEHRTIVENIKEELDRIQEGDQAPEFCLYDRDSNLVCLEDFRGEYVYLGFCNSMNYSCNRHYKILKNLYEQHKDHFRIVIISNAPDHHQMEKFAEHYDYQWTFLHHGNQPKVLKEYEIEVMPTYFFIGKDGKLLLSPAPAPSEKVEWGIYKEMKSRGDL